MDPHAAMYRRLLSVFSAEAAERIHRVNGALLALERGDGGTDHTEALTGIMRELHTLKGAGGSVNLEDVETLSHDLESVFGPILEGERELSHPIFAVAYRTLDAIGELIAAAVEERAADVDLGALVTEMHDAADGTVAESPPPPDANPAEQGSADRTDADPIEAVDHASLLRSLAELQEPFGDEDAAFGEELSALSSEPPARPADQPRHEPEDEEEPTGFAPTTPNEVEPTVDGFERTDG